MSDDNPDFQIAKTDSEPWSGQQPSLSNLFAQAGTQLGTPKQYFPNATFVPPSNQTEAGLTGIENLATQGGQLTPAATQQSLKTIQGDYLNSGNPEFQGMVDRIGRSIRPNIDAAFAGAGRGGSGAHSNSYASALADTAGTLAYQNYGDERNRQMSAVTGAPGLDAARFADPQQLMGVGTAREGYAGSELQDSISRFDFGQNERDQALARYAALVSGGSFGGSTTQRVPTTSNPWATGLGAASSLAGIAGSLFGNGGIF